MSTLDGLGARLSELIQHTGLSQADFSERLGTSPSFVSDVVRGLKRPGSEFLHKLREVFGVSLDWLIDGTGAMHGGRPIEMDLFKLIAAQIVVARSARIDGDPKAEALLRQLQASESGKSLPHELVGDLLRPYVKASEETILAAVIYNSHLWSTNSDERARGALNSATAYFDANRPLDVLRALMGEQPRAGTASNQQASSPAQVNIGRSVRAAGRDYHERPKSPKKP